MRGRVGVGPRQTDASSWVGQNKWQVGLILMHVRAMHSLSVTHRLSECGARTLSNPRCQKLNSQALRTGIEPPVTSNLRSFVPCFAPFWQILPHIVPEEPPLTKTVPWGLASGRPKKKVVAQMSKCDFLGPIFHCDSGLCRGLRFCGRKKSPPQKTTPRAEVVPLDPSRSSPPNGGADPTSSKW